MPYLSPFAGRRDPFWDYDGAHVRQRRKERRVLRVGLMVLAGLFIALVLVRLPAFDSRLILDGTLKPVLAVAMVALSGTWVLVALSRLQQSRHP